MPITLIVCLIMGVVCSIVAHQKGRNAVGWFFIGFLLGLIGLIIVLVVPNLKEEESRRQAIEQENRRLREQIRQEQIKAEAFRTNTQYRLDAHDQKLGIETRADDRLLGSDSPLPAMIESNEPQGSAVAAGDHVAGESAAGWYYAVDSQTLGPVSAAQITELLQKKTLPMTAMVWTEGMADWSRIEQVPQFSVPVNP